MGRKRVRTTRKTGRKRKTKVKKLSRFDLSRKGELVLAGVGVLILGSVLAFAAWLALTRWVLPKNPAETAWEAEVTAKRASDWDALQRGDLLRELREEQGDLYVDGKAWAALSLGRREDFAAAAAAHLGLRRCFVYDAATGKELGWYTEGGGYRMPPPNKHLPSE